FRVIREDFSQKQRLLLEQWISDQAVKPKPKKRPGGVKKARVQKGCPVKGVLALEDRQREERRRRSSGFGGLFLRGRSGYDAEISFDGITIHTQTCGLQTGLEMLMVLTSIRQHYVSGCGHFEQRLRQACAAAVKDHQLRPGEIKLRFQVRWKLAWFVGPLALRSPLTKGISTLVQWRHQLQPYRMTLRQGAEKVGPDLRPHWTKLQ
ncbi:unnamed protein product, partial [Effrenium voratum]